MIVIDASVIFKWFDTNEEFHLQAKTYLKQHLLTQNRIIIPELLLFEISNAWATKTRLSEEDIKDNLTRLERYSLQVVSINFELLEQAVRFSKKYQVSVYDAVYAAIAEDKKCDLVTADDKFVDKVNMPFIKRLADSR